MLRIPFFIFIATVSFSVHASESEYGGTKVPRTCTNSGWCMEVPEMLLYRAKVSVKRVEVVGITNGLEIVRYRESGGWSKVADISGIEYPVSSAHYSTKVIPELFVSERGIWVLVNTSNTLGGELSCYRVEKKYVSQDSCPTSDIEKPTWIEPNIVDVWSDRRTRTAPNGYACASSSDTEVLSYLSDLVPAGQAFVCRSEAVLALMVHDTKSVRTLHFNTDNSAPLGNTYPYGHKNPMMFFVDSVCQPCAIGGGDFLEGLVHIRQHSGWRFLKMPTAPEQQQWSALATTKNSVCVTAKSQARCFSFKKNRWMPANKQNLSILQPMYPSVAGLQGGGFGLLGLNPEGILTTKNGDLTLTTFHTLWHRSPGAVSPGSLFRVVKVADNDTLNIRRSPNASRYTKIVTKAKLDECLQAEDYPPIEGWFLVRRLTDNGALRGWAHGRYLQRDPDCLPIQ